MLIFYPKNSLHANHFYLLPSLLEEWNYWFLGSTGISSVVTSRNRDNMMRCRIIFTLTVYINFCVMNDDIDGSVTHYEYYYVPRRRTRSRSALMNTTKYGVPLSDNVVVSLLASLSISAGNGWPTPNLLIIRNVIWIDIQLKDYATRR